MTRFCTIALSLLLCCQSVHGEGALDSASGAPLARSVAREASRLALEGGANAEPPDWETLRELAPGKRIIVTTLTTTLAGEFISAESATLVLQRGDAVEHVNADDVLFVSARVRRGSAPAAVFGTLRGIWLGSALAYGLAETTQCYWGLRRGEVGNVGRDCRCSDCRRVWRLAAEQPSDRRGRLPSSLIVAPDNADPALR